MMHTRDIYEHRARQERQKELRAMMRALIRLLSGSSARQTCQPSGGAALRDNDNRRDVACPMGRDGPRSTGGAMVRRTG